MEKNYEKHGNFNPEMGCVKKTSHRKGFGAKHRMHHVRILNSCGVTCARLDCRFPNNQIQELKQVACQPLTLRIALQAHLDLKSRQRI